MSREDVVQLTERWLAGWNLGSKAFDGDVFLDIFAEGQGAISVFDNVAGDVVVLTSAEAYAATWTPFMAPMTYWSVRLEDLRVTTSGDLAYSTFRLVGVDTRGPDGEPLPFGQYGTHVWRKGPTGWRLLHEHLTAYDRSKEAR
ncbi:MAG: nuclear transport factor 2 family protein [Pseudomonadota bacterium]